MFGYSTQPYSCSVPVSLDLHVRRERIESERCDDRGHADEVELGLDLLVGDREEHHAADLSRPPVQWMTVSEARYCALTGPISHPDDSLAVSSPLYPFGTPLYRFGTPPMHGRTESAPRSLSSAGAAFGDSQQIRSRAPIAEIGARTRTHAIAPAGRC